MWFKANKLFLLWVVIVFEAVTIASLSLQPQPSSPAVDTVVISNTVLVTLFF